ncbi:MAG TPA: hypothetical protein VGK88_02325 [bacterium]|jgi:hypothetical protein
MGGRRSGIILLVIGVLVAAAGLTAWGTQRDTNPAANQPAVFAWKTMIEISRAANNGSNDTIWETWATDDDTFPPNGNPAACTGLRPDPKQCPVWPGLKHRSDNLQPIQKLEALGIETDEQEVVYRNKPTYDYIVSNNLWYRDGLIDAFLRAQAGSFEVDFPIDSIEVKAIWIPINVRDKPRYHWNYADDGLLYGLAAFHIMTKDLPLWFWATFEHVDVIGRCDFIGCHDQFGAVPQRVNPNGTSGGLYPPGRLSAELVALMRRRGLGSEWLNYRLKGTQTQYTDATGTPTLLGNTLLEKGFVPTASCMTCHGRSTVNAAGQTLSVFRSRNPRAGHVGPPVRSWYYNADGSAKFLPLDFVWAFINVLKPLPPDQ